MIWSRPEVAAENDGPLPPVLKLNLALRFLAKAKPEVPARLGGCASAAVIDLSVGMFVGAAADSSQADAADAHSPTAIAAAPRMAILRMMSSP